jgi:hypothetical protein
VSQKQVRNDLEQGVYQYTRAPSPTITGQDGKQYAAKREKKVRDKPEMDSSRFDAFLAL